MCRIKASQALAVTAYFSPIQTLTEPQAIRFQVGAAENAILWRAPRGFYFIVAVNPTISPGAASFKRVTASSAFAHTLRGAEDWYLPRLRTVHNDQSSEAAQAGGGPNTTTAFRPPNANEFDIA